MITKLLYRIYKNITQILGCFFLFVWFIFLKIITLIFIYGYLIAKLL